MLSVSLEAEKRRGFGREPALATAVNDYKVQFANLEKTTVEKKLNRMAQV